MVIDSCIWLKITLIITHKLVPEKVGHVVIWHFTDPLDPLRFYFGFTFTLITCVIGILQTG